MAGAARHVTLPRPGELDTERVREHRGLGVGVTAMVEPPFQVPAKGCMLPRQLLLEAALVHAADLDALAALAYQLGADGPHHVRVPPAVLDGPDVPHGHQPQPTHLDWNPGLQQLCLGDASAAAKKQTTDDLVLELSAASNDWRCSPVRPSGSLAGGRVRGR